MTNFTAVKTFKCPSCGSSIEFNPATQEWDCKYCNNSFTQEEINKANIDNTQSESDEDEKELAELDSYTCSNCGAELITDKNTSATFCIYCKSPTIIKSRFSGEFKPSYVIPFKLTKENAIELYKEWIKKKTFAPKSFKRKEEVDKLTGVYAPFWLFDCDANGMIEGTATKVRTWSDNDYNYTETSFYHVERDGQTMYEKIPVDASIKFEDKYMEMSEPYDYGEMKDFSIGFMSGFMAERYDKSSEESEKRMESRSQGFLHERLTETVTGYTSFSVENSDFNAKTITSSYAMFPVYFLVNKYLEKDHIFIVNGQSGKVVGDTPVSKNRVILFVLITFLALVLIIVFGGALIV